MKALDVARQIQKDPSPTATWKEELAFLLAITNVLNLCPKVSGRPHLLMAMMATVSTHMIAPYLYKNHQRDMSLWMEG